MPALPPVVGLARIIVRQTLANVAVYNILHAFNSGGTSTDSGELATLAGAVRSSWVTNVIPLQDSDLTLGDVTAIDLSSDAGQEGTASGSTIGLAAGTSISANAAVCWSWRISRRYRGGHPRTYIAGLNTNHLLSPNTLVAATVTSHAAAAAALRAAINATATSDGNWQHVVPHYVRDGEQLAVPLVSIINSVSVDNRVDSQRRRLGRDR